MDYLEQAQQYISSQKNGFEYFALMLGIFFAWSAIGDWNWMYDPPYNSVKNPIGYWLGRKAFRVTIFIFGIFLIAGAVLLLMRSK
ncbi:hypothetical protein ACTJIJ_21620 [Niabella sp. 22666]|uniref:hypothetical protein n=1 Tax=Niabella sp. 22666 TaxID=3453954 RepID=UPI003F83C82F